VCCYSCLLCYVCFACLLRILVNLTKPYLGPIRGPIGSIGGDRAKGGREEGAHVCFCYCFLWFVYFNDVVCL
jgi:hypothetical protein